MIINMFERIFAKTKSVKMTDEQLIEKIKSLVGQKITIMGICGDVEQAHITKYVGLAREYNPQNLGLKLIILIIKQLFTIWKP